MIMGSLQNLHIEFLFAGGFRDGPNFNGRFEGPDDFFRGPGGPRMRPPMFNDGSPRFRGRFDDRSWDRPDHEYENMDHDAPPGYEDRDHGPPPEYENRDRDLPLEFENHGHGPTPGNRQGRRSRWGHDDGGDLGSEEVASEFNRGSTTPVFDEFPAQGETANDQSGVHEANDGFQQSVECHLGNQESVDPHNDGDNENLQQNQENFSVENVEHFEGNAPGADNFQGGDNFQGEENCFNEGNGGENIFQGNEENFEGGSNFENNRNLLDGGEQSNENCDDIQEKATSYHDTDAGGVEDNGQSHTDANASSGAEAATE